MDFLQTIIMGALQGFTELFPISSLGHSVILPQLLGWHIDQSSDYFLVFVVATHFATALVLLWFFRKDWLLILKGIFRSLKNRMIDPADTYAKLGWLIVVATVPVGMLGLLLEEKLKLLFSSGIIVSLFLIGNGILLDVFERARMKTQDSLSTDPDQAAARLTWKQAVKIGLAECVALLPGFSRTGLTLGAGLFAGLDHAAAARFSFLLATPVIFAASALKLPLLAAASFNTLPILIGAVASGTSAYFSVKFLEKYFMKKTLLPFSAYCMAGGVIAFFLLLIR